jgi:hypothetical protein
MRELALVFALVSTLGFSWCSRTSAGTKVSSISNAAGSESTKARSQNSLALTATTDSRAQPASDVAKLPAKVDFATQIKPILEARCQPCHFSGGKVYQKMPFDRPETIKTLGAKLFTRIKDENERRLIRDFLAQD